MSPTCRRAASLTSGDHPESDPDLSSPGGPGLRERPQDFGPRLPRGPRADNGEQCGGRSGGRRGTADEPEGADGGQPSHGSVTRAPELSRPTMHRPFGGAGVTAQRGWRQGLLRPRRYRDLTWLACNSRGCWRGWALPARPPRRVSLPARRSSSTRRARPRTGRWPGLAGSRAVRRIDQNDRSTLAFLLAWEVALPGLAEPHRQSLHSRGRHKR